MILCLNKVKEQKSQRKSYEIICHKVRKDYKINCDFRREENLWSLSVEILYRSKITTLSSHFNYEKHIEIRELNLKILRYVEIIDRNER